VRRRREPSDPIFAAEMDALWDQRRAAERGRVGTGLPVGAKGQPEPVDPNGPLGLNLHIPCEVPRSTFRPSGSAR
jgi:hypothetical protein